MVENIPCPKFLSVENVCCYFYGKHLDEKRFEKYLVEIVFGRIIVLF